MAQKVSITQRLRIVTLYFPNKPKFTRGRFTTLRDLAKNEGFNVSVRSVRRIVSHWEATGSVIEKSCLNRRLANTKISQNQMNSLDRLSIKKGINCKKRKNTFKFKSFNENSAKIFKFTWLETSLHSILSIS